jgi:hypothetical protein
VILRSTLLAVVVFLGSLNVAKAQSYVHSGVAGSQTVLGWTWGHVAYCDNYFDGSTMRLYVYFQEAGSGYGFTNDPAFQTALAPACQNGNWVAAYVYNLNPLLWSQVLTVPWK